MNILPALARIDSYKLGHMAQYPNGTEFVYSNFTPRSIKHFEVPKGFENNEIVAFGMYAAVQELHEVFHTTFFERPLDEVKAEFEELIRPFTGPSGFDVSKIEELWRYGKLPLCIKSLPEGSIITPQIPVMTLENEDPRFYWLTNFIETWLSAAMWKPMTSATIAYAYRRILEHYAELTSAPMEFVDWQAHDFSSRGMSGMEDAARTGMGHMVFFKGSDNISAVWNVGKIYDTTDEFLAGSVPATEHSVMCMGSKEDEIDTFSRLITEVYPKGIVSIVSDTWDFWKVITQYARALQVEIMEREPDELGMAKTVFRPDSGMPEDIICGTAIPFNPSKGEYLWDTKPGVYLDTLTNDYYELTEDGGISQLHDPLPSMKGAVMCLWEIFGGMLTDKGYKMLDPHVGLIYGDSITLERANEILSRLEKMGFASSNVILGVGSYTYQYVTRDTLGTAMKATHGVVSSKSVHLFKDPITDHGKKSATGLLCVERINGKYTLRDKVSYFDETGGELKTIYSQGKISPKPNFGQIRARANGKKTNND